MRVILEPLIGDVPIVGAVTMFFIRRPVGPFEVTSIFPFQPLFDRTIMCPFVVSKLYFSIDSLSVLIDLL